MTNNNTHTYLHIHDPSHSWLKVPVKDLRDIAGLEIFDDITSYSPMKRGFLYLEEDCDMPTFLNAMTNKGYTVNTKNLNVNDFEGYLQNTV